MKLHLPSCLRAALVACFGVASLSTSWADAVITTDVEVATNTGLGDGLITFDGGSAKLTANVTIANVLASAVDSSIVIDVNGTTSSLTGGFSANSVLNISDSAGTNGMLTLGATSALSALNITDANVTLGAGVNLNGVTTTVNSGAVLTLATFASNNQNYNMGNLTLNAGSTLVLSNTRCGDGTVTVAGDTTINFTGTNACTFRGSVVQQAGTTMTLNITTNITAGNTYVGWIGGAASRLQGEGTIVVYAGTGTNALRLWVTNITHTGTMDIRQGQVCYGSSATDGGPGFAFSNMILNGGEFVFLHAQTSLMQNTIFQFNGGAFTHSNSNNFGSSSLIGAINVTADSNFNLNNQSNYEIKDFYGTADLTVQGSSALGLITINKMTDYEGTLNINQGTVIVKEVSVGAGKTSSISGTLGQAVGENITVTGGGTLAFVNTGN